MTDTIYISGKLKRNILISELYEKISKSIKKKGPTKLWECHMTEFGDTIIIDFNDEGSETFGLTFNEKTNFMNSVRLISHWKETFLRMGRVNLRH